MTVTFTLENLDNSKIDINYEPLPYEHSQLWLQGIKDFLDTGNPLIDNERLFNFGSHQNVIDYLDKTNKLIDEINSYLQGIVMPNIRYENIQQDVNFVHINFAETDRGAEYTKFCRQELWNDLNSRLHGLETIMRHNNSYPQGQIFVELNCQRYVLPENAYKHFTVKDTFGICYANYAHIGRHIQEVVYAEDELAYDTHILPMSKISGSSRLWFGDTLPAVVERYQMFRIKRWFDKHNISNIVNMEWGDPHLAIGWLPVAKMTNNITKEDLRNVVKIKEISLQ